MVDQAPGRKGRGSECSEKLKNCSVVGRVVPEDPRERFGTMRRGGRWIMRRYKTPYGQRKEKGAALPEWLCEASIPDLKTCHVYYNGKKAGEIIIFHQHMWK